MAGWLDMVGSQCAYSIVRCINLTTKVTLLAYTVCLAAVGITLSILDRQYQSVPPFLAYVIVVMALIATTSVIINWRSPSHPNFHAGEPFILAWFAFLMGLLEPQKPGMWIAATAIILSGVRAAINRKRRRSARESAKSQEKRRSYGNR
jgi:hypothetical protein